MKAIGRFQPRWGLFGFAILLAAPLLIGGATLHWWPSKNGHGFLHQVYTDEAGQDWKYTVFIPFRYDYSGTDSYPTILFLHGMS
jgi:hypothetical protein